MKVSVCSLGLGAALVLSVVTMPLQAQMVQARAVQAQVVQAHVVHAQAVQAANVCLGAGNAGAGEACDPLQRPVTADRGIQANVDATVLPGDAATARQGVRNLASPALSPVLAGTQTLQARAWMQSGAVAVGLGADTPLAASASTGQGLQPGDGTRPVLAVRADVAPGARMSFEHVGRRLDSVPPSPVFGPDAGNSADQRTARLGLEFKPVKRSAQMPLGTLRFQLSGASTLSLRPRSGGMAMSYRSTF